MIQYFSTLYAGHVLEGDNIGLHGTPHDDRLYDNDRLALSFNIAKDISITMEALGYDILWMAEHHFQREGYETIPNLMMLSVWLSQFTQRLKFGCGFNILPMWHPIRLAEDFAMADILTQGRLVFGVGRGYHTREVETFGAPMTDADANRELFEEQFEIIMKAFNEESFSHKGKHYTLPPEVPYRGYTLKDITLVPRPANRPVETWQPMVSGSERGLNFMAKHGIKGVILGTAEAYIGDWMSRFQAANAKHGRNLKLGENLALGLWCYMDDSYDKAKQTLRPIFEEHVKFAAPLGMLRYSDEQMKATGPAGVATHIAAGSSFEDVIQNRAWFCGTPQDTVTYLQQLQDRYPGLEHIMLGFPMGLSAAQFKDQLTLFAEEVMPAFKTTKVSV